MRAYFSHDVIWWERARFYIFNVVKNELRPCGSQKAEFGGWESVVEGNTKIPLGFVPSTTSDADLVMAVVMTACYRHVRPITRHWYSYDGTSSRREYVLCLGLRTFQGWDD